MQGEYTPNLGLGRVIHRRSIDYHEGDYKDTIQQQVTKEHKERTEANHANEVNGIHNGENALQNINVRHYDKRGQHTHMLPPAGVSVFTPPAYGICPPSPVVGIRIYRWYESLFQRPRA